MSGSDTVAGGSRRSGRGCGGESRATGGGGTDAPGRAKEERCGQGESAGGLSDAAAQRKTGAFDLEALTPATSSVTARFG